MTKEEVITMMPEITIPSVIFARVGQRSYWYEVTVIMLGVAASNERAAHIIRDMDEKYFNSLFGDITPKNCEIYSVDMQETCIVDSYLPAN